MMSRYGSAGSYGHKCEYFRSFGGWYRVYWTVDFYYSGSRSRFPRHFSRDVDEKGAQRFCNKWDIPFPDSQPEKTKTAP